MKHYIITTCLIWFYLNFINAEIPIVINTWAFPQAADKAWSVMEQEHISAVDAVTIGCTTCEELQCDHAVGYGGTPDENGETTLDAMIFDGLKMDMGAVGGLRRIKNAMGVARRVLENTQHSFVVGDLATEFAKKFDFPEESLQTNYSLNLWEQWKTNSCQPNFWRNVQPDPTKSCGPYHPSSSANFVSTNRKKLLSSHTHDTIGMISIDENGNVAAGTSTNGLIHKISGRVGDSPIAGAGAYADNEVGAAVATGDGDVMMRFLPTFLAVEEMRKGASPRDAAWTAVGRITKKYPNFFGAVLVSNNKGEFAAACNGMETFPFAVASKGLGGVVLKTVDCKTTKYIKT